MRAVFNAPLNANDHGADHLNQSIWLGEGRLNSLQETLLGQIGALQVRLASSQAEVEAAQKLRFKVFFEELGAQCSIAQKASQRDIDQFDAVCDHLLVVDTALDDVRGSNIVGTYRLLPQERARAIGGFYSDNEFALQKLVSQHPDKKFLELGRSCVLPEYRSKRTIELLWQGIWNYCQRGVIDVMTGCASFSGTDIEVHAEALSFLYHYCRSEAEWSVRAQADRYVSMNLKAKEAINSKSALSSMPPLIKGYLRLGAKFGDGCVVDREFDTIDVLVVLPVTSIADRYIAYYGGTQAGPAA